jgi:hypothetical protein
MKEEVGKIDTPTRLKISQSCEKAKWLMGFCYQEQIAMYVGIESRHIF